jgi:hypothetical protein
MYALIGKSVHFGEKFRLFAVESGLIHFFTLIIHILYGRVMMTKIVLGKNERIRFLLESIGYDIEFLTTFWPDEWREEFRVSLNNWMLAKFTINTDGTKETKDGTTTE